MTISTLLSFVFISIQVMRVPKRYPNTGRFLRLSVKPITFLVKIDCHKIARDLLNVSLCSLPEKHAKSIKCWKYFPDKFNRNRIVCEFASCTFSFDLSNVR